MRKTMIVISLIFGSIFSNAARLIPYPSALSEASVSQEEISDISRRGMVIGNGELNAIVYSVKNNIHLRIAKNDCWDLRVDTESDPPMPTIDVVTGKITNSHSTAKSWKSPYPTALPCAELVLSDAESNSRVTSTNLDLAQAVAKINTTQESLNIRVLAQENVVLIQSERPLSFVGITEFLKDKDINKWISRSEQHQVNNFRYLHQNIPGDKDVSGMDIYVVAGRRASLQAVAVVTSRDTNDPLRKAIELVKKTLSDKKAVAKHEMIWEDFWSKSGIELGDKELQNWWYRMAYFFRVFSRTDGNVIGLAACFDKLAGWHNSLKINYNIQQTYLAAAPIGHPELLEPFIDHLNRSLPRAKWFARTSFIGSEGAFFFSDLYPFEPDPEKCQTKWKHQQTYMPWGYTWGMQGHISSVIWDYYKYAPSNKSLNRVYPLIKEFAIFYCSVLEKCKLVDGKRMIGPSYFPELGRFNQYNVCYDIQFIHAALQIGIEAAQLKGDKNLVSRFTENLNKLPDFGVQRDPMQNNQTVIEQWSGARFNEGADRHGTLIQGIFPAGIINWFSSPELKELGKRTINRVEASTNHANSNVSINIARARLGLGDEAIANAKMCFSGTNVGKYSKEQPNGLFAWSGHGYYMTEQVAIARFVTELLLQSVGDVIRIFPAWPASVNASFSDIRAQGGFSVSADQVKGTIKNLRIHSTVGGVVKLLNPWPNQKIIVTEEKNNARILINFEDPLISFSTTAGKSYLLNRID